MTRSARKFNDPFPMWEDKHGDLWAISELKTDHILACIIKIKRSSKLWRVQYLPLLEAEYAKRTNGGTI